MNYSVKNAKKAEPPGVGKTTLKEIVNFTNSKKNR